jgi:hypothetical protein
MTQRKTRVVEDERARWITIAYPSTTTPLLFIHRLFGELPIRCRSSDELQRHHRELH